MQAMSDEDRINLANLILDRLKKKSSLEEYVSVSLDGTDLEAVSLGTLLYYLEEYYSRATTTRSVFNFLTEDIGIHRSRCILIIGIADDDLYRRVAVGVAHNTTGYYIARAENTSRLKQIVTFFDVMNMACGLIIEEPLPGLSLHSLSEILEHNSIPSMIITNDNDPKHLLNLIAHEASAVVIPNQHFDRSFVNGLDEMFMDERNL